MSTKWIGWIAAGVSLVAAAGGLYWYLKRRGAKQDDGRETPEPVPSEPFRTSKNPKQTAGYEFMASGELQDDERELLSEIFEDGWPPTEETLDSLETGDVIVFAVESRPVGSYVRPARELISARVTVAEKTVILARVTGEIRNGEHLGTIAGHGLRTGMAVDVPRKYVLAAGRPKRGEGYGSEGDPAGEFAPSTETKKTYTIYPATPYDLQLPHRTSELEWYVDSRLAKMIHIGERGLLEQVMFTEGSLRGKITVRAIDNDPVYGKVLVGRWDFALTD